VEISDEWLEIVRCDFGLAWIRNVHASNRDR
jgi:hypothetical protein